MVSLPGVSITSSRAVVGTNNGLLKVFKIYCCRVTNNVFYFVMWKIALKKKEEKINLWGLEVCRENYVALSLFLFCFFLSHQSHCLRNKTVWVNIININVVHLWLFDLNLITLSAFLLSTKIFLGSDIFYKKKWDLAFSIFLGNCADNADFKA